MLNFRDQKNAKRQGDELVRRYGQGVATAKADAELASKPDNEYWEAVRQRITEDVPPGERHPIMGSPLVHRVDPGIGAAKVPPPHRVPVL